MYAEFPRLVGDIGGTNARFAFIESPAAKLNRIEVLLCAEYATVADALSTYMDYCGLRAGSAALGIANPLVGDEVRMTNHHWCFSASALRNALSLTRLVMLNDFTAMALGVPSLSPAQRQAVGQVPDARGPIAVLGPGTVLGVSGLVPQGTGLIALAGEGGHATLPASTEREAAAIAWLRRKHGNVSAERVLSGPGLAGLYQALAALEAETAPELELAEVAHVALTDPASIARRATDMFCEMLGTVAADVALTLGATGGAISPGAWSLHWAICS